LSLRLRIATQYRPQDAMRNSGLDYVN